MNRWRTLRIGASPAALPDRIGIGTGCRCSYDGGGYNKNAGSDDFLDYHAVIVRKKSSAAWRAIGPGQTEISWPEGLRSAQLWALCNSRRQVEQTYSRV